MSNEIVTNEEKNIQLLIDENFETMIPSLSYSEKKQLEESLINDGCLSPIIVWGSKNKIIDGHNRYHICKEKNIPFRIEKIEFGSENEAMTWIVKNQFGRRNLNAYQRAFLAICYEDIFKAQALEKRNSCLKQNQLTDNQNSDKQSLSEITNDEKKHKKEELNTNQMLASMSKLSHDTIARVKYIIERIDKHTHIQLLNGSNSINKVYNHILKEERQKQAKENESNKNKSFDVIYGHFDNNTKYSDFKKLTDKAAMNSTLLFWSEIANLDLCIASMKKAGFKYRLFYTWINENAPQFLFVLVVATKGSLQTNFEFKEARLVYSEKADYKKFPEYYYQFIEFMFPNQKLLEAGTSIPHNENWFAESTIDE